MIQTKNNGRRFRIQESEINHFNPIAGSFAVVKCMGKYLLCYNVWRNQWEIPAGSREGNESPPMECAKRELYEETGQLLKDMDFVGLLRLFQNARYLSNGMNGTVLVLTNIHSLFIMEV